MPKVEELDLVFMIMPWRGSSDSRAVCTTVPAGCRRDGGCVSTTPTRFAVVQISTRVNAPPEPFEPFDTTPESTVLLLPPLAGASGRDKRKRGAKGSMLKCRALVLIVPGATDDQADPYTSRAVPGAQARSCA